MKSKRVRGAEEVWDSSHSGSGFRSSRRGSGKGGFGVRRAIRHGVADWLHSAAIHLLRRVRQVDTQSGISPARLPAPFHAPIPHTFHTHYIPSTPIPHPPHTLPLWHLT